MSPHPPIRYAFAVADGPLNHWQSAVIHSAQEVDGPELVGVFRAPPATAVRRRGVTGLVERLLRRIAGRSEALGPATAGLLIDPDEAPTWLARVDVLIDLRARSQAIGLQHQIGETWAFDPTPEAIDGWIQPMISGEPTTTVRLTKRRHGSDRTSTIAEAVFPTIPHSPRRQLDQAMLGSVKLVQRELRRAALGRVDAVDESTPRSPTPSTWSLLRFFAALPGRWATRQYNGVVQADRWHVGIVDRPISSMVDGGQVGSVHWLPVPPGDQRYIADPFGLVDADGAVTVLVEDYDHVERHGRLSSYRLSKGTVEGPTPLHEFPVHASYPYLIEVDNEWWCIPETSAAGTLRAFRLGLEDLSLTDIGVLIEGTSVVDATMFEHEDHWWIFATDATDGANTHLRAWWAPHPAGPWTQHAIDPLAIDIAGARGAGTPFQVDGALFRPAQDCTTGYGSAISIRHVRSLSPTEFDEVEHSRLTPNPDGPYPDGLHTLSALGDRVLVDGTVHGFAPSAMWHELATRGSIAWSRLVRR